MSLGEKWSFPKKETQGKPRGIVTAVVSLWFPFYGNTHVVSTWFPQQETVNMWFPSSFHKQETCRKPPRGFQNGKLSTCGFPLVSKKQETYWKLPKGFHNRRLSTCGFHKSQKQNFFVFRQIIVRETKNRKDVMI